MEGKYYLCTWSHSKRLYTVTLKSDPTITTNARTFDEAEEAFCMLLGDRFGDGEPVIEFDHPPPRSTLQNRYSDPAIVEIRGGSTFEVTNTPHLFTGKRCSVCKRQASQRTDVPLECGQVVKTTDAAMSLLVTVNALVCIYSEAFLALLTDEERSVLELRPVIRSARSRKHFFELVGRPLAKYVGVPGFPGLLDQKCKACHLCCFDYLYQGELYSFLALHDLPSPVPSVFVVQNELGNVSLCMTRKRYATIVGKPGTQGVISRPLYVVRDNHFIRDNDQEQYPEELLFHR